jgi:hypothetical protein
MARRASFTPEERHGLTIWGGHGLASMVLVLLAWPFGREELPAMYPPLAVLTGLAVFLAGDIFWGWGYLLGLAYFVLGTLMKLQPDWAPLEFGLFYGVTTGSMAWYLRRQRDERGSPAGPS